MLGVRKKAQSDTAIARVVGTMRFDSESALSSVFPCVCNAVAFYSLVRVVGDRVGGSTLGLTVANLGLIGISAVRIEADYNA